MNKSMQAFLISLVFIGVLLFAVPTLGPFCSVLFGIIPVLVAMFGVKDKQTSSKTLQPYIILAAIAVVRLFFDFLFYIIITMGGDVNAQMAYLIIQVILLIVLVALEIVALVFICLKKDVPVVGGWANKIAGVEEKSQSKKAAKKSAEKPAENQDDSQEQTEDEE